MEKMSSSPEVTGEHFVRDLFNQLGDLVIKPDSEQALVQLTLPTASGYSSMQINPHIMYNVPNGLSGPSSELLIVGRAQPNDHEADAVTVVATFRATQEPLEKSLHIQPIIPQQA